MKARIALSIFGPAFAGMALMTLLDAALKGLALFAAAGLVALAMRRASAATRHVVWLSALAGALALPCCAWLLPQWRVLPAWMNWPEIPKRAAAIGISARTSMPDAVLVIPEDSVDHELAPVILPPGTLPAKPAISRDSTVRRLRLDAPTLLLAWSAGAALFLSPLLCSVLKLARLSRRARRIEDGPLANEMQTLQRELGLDRKVELLLGDEGTMPMVWGLVRYRLLLPTSATSWEHSRIRGVLLHELSHLRRRDPLSLLIAQLALAVHWFNPLAWLAVRRLRVEQERACDDAVLRHGIRASDYASDLIAVTTSARAMPFAAAALTMAHPARLEGRIAGILDGARDRRALTKWLAVAAACVAVVIALPLAMLRAAEAQKPLPTGSHEMPPVLVINNGIKPADMAETKSVNTTADSAEIEVEEKLGQLSFVVGEGDAAKTIVHFFGSAKEPITFHATADDRQGKWWDQVRLTRIGEANATLPVLPTDWLPIGRLVFLPGSAKRPGGTHVFAEIESPSGRIPVGVRSASATEVSLSQYREAPRTSSELECTVDMRIHALGTDAPAKALILPLMAAEDLVGPPRGALTRPYFDLTPGKPQTYNRTSGLEEQIEMVATLVPGVGVRLEGTVAVGFVAGKFSSAPEAWKQTDEAAFNDKAKTDMQQLRGPVSATLGLNDALVVPIASNGIFPETLVAVMKVQTHRLPRLRWKPPATRSPIQVDGWVLTWAKSDHPWFTEQFDYDGIPGMIKYVLEKRKKGGMRSESVGTLRQHELDQLLETFRSRPGVKLERVEPFTAPQYPPLTRTTFVAAGERGSVMMSTSDDQTISSSLKWEVPNSSGSGYAIHSGTSLCQLLPGSPDPQEIRMLAIRYVDPDAEVTLPGTQAKTKSAQSTDGTPTRSIERPGTKSAEAESGLRGRLLDRSGIVLAESTEPASRRYPFPSLASHTLGFVGRADKAGALEGRTGAEKLYEARLSKGEDVSLTLDAKLQAELQKIMRAAGVERGVAVILDPTTGDLLADVSLPNFDSNVLSKPISQEKYRAMRDDPKQPLLDRSIEAYTPGSVFKVVVGLAACRTGKTESAFDCAGYVQYEAKALKCWIAATGVSHGHLNLRDALAQSCNCYFYQLANQVGIDSIVDTANQLGLGSRTAIGWTGEKPGLVMSPDWLRSTEPNARWSDGFTANASIGQGATITTPLQMANVAATVANGGRVLLPRLVADGPPQYRFDFVADGCKPEKLAVLQGGMRDVVEKTGSTGNRAKSELIAIAGKTGSTQEPRGADGNRALDSNAWFIGYAPAEAPRYAFAVLVEGGKSGGLAAAPIARSIMEATVKGLPELQAR